MIRIVPDTNVIVSAFFWGGPPREILVASQNKRCQIVTSETLLAELLDVISRPKFADRLTIIGQTPTGLMNLYRALAEIVEPAKIQPIIVDDPDDDVLIACALGGSAEVIVSGDRHLRELGEYQGITVQTVRQFLDSLAS